MDVETILIAVWVVVGLILFFLIALTLIAILVHGLIYFITEIIEYIKYLRD